MELILIVSLTLFFVNKVWFALIPCASECCLLRSPMLAPQGWGFRARVAKALH